jgi:cyclopropane-fatty-acyl-phospholipid synthase
VATVERESLTTQATHRPPKTVVTCYSVIDDFFSVCGICDLTEGMFFGDSNVSLEEAQSNQIEFLLDQVECDPGSRILDVGCGYGTLVARAERRGATATGITLSPEQVRYGRLQGLDIRKLDYREMGPEWERHFDGIVANGSLEHYVQPRDAAEGRADDVYRDFFRRMHLAIDPQSPGKLVTTAIHFVRQPDSGDLLRHPLWFPRGSDAFHYGLLARSFGGWYPALGQLERCAEGHFTLEEETDGTDDYCRTSEEWLVRMRQAFASRKGIRIAIASLPTMLLHPVQLTTMLVCMLVTESWNWQFRPPDPPTRLLRQRWQYVW